MLTISVQADELTSPVTDLISQNIALQQQGSFAQLPANCRTIFSKNPHVVSAVDDIVAFSLDYAGVNELDPVEGFLGKEGVHYSAEELIRVYTANSIKRNYPDTPAFLSNTKFETDNILGMMVNCGDDISYRECAANQVNFCVEDRVKKNLAFKLLQKNIKEQERTCASCQEIFQPLPPELLKLYGQFDFMGCINSNSKEKARCSCLAKKLDKIQPPSSLYSEDFLTKLSCKLQHYQVVRDLNRLKSRLTNIVLSQEVLKLTGHFQDDNSSQGMDEFTVARLCIENSKDNDESLRAIFHTCSPRALKLIKRISNQTGSKQPWDLSSADAFLNSYYKTINSAIDKRMIEVSLQKAVQTDGGMLNNISIESTYTALDSLVLDSFDELSTVDMQDKQKISSIVNTLLKKIKENPVLKHNTEFIGILQDLKQGKVDQGLKNIFSSNLNKMEKKEQLKELFYRELATSASISCGDALSAIAGLCSLDEKNIDHRTNAQEYVPSYFQHWQASQNKDGMTGDSLKVLKEVVVCSLNEGEKFNAYTAKMLSDIGNADRCKISKEELEKNVERPDEFAESVIGNSKQGSAKLTKFYKKTLGDNKEVIVKKAKQIDKIRKQQLGNRQKSATPNTPTAAVPNSDSGEPNSIKKVQENVPANSSQRWMSNLSAQQISEELTPAQQQEIESMASKNVDEYSTQIDSAEKKLADLESQLQSDKSKSEGDSEALSGNQELLDQITKLKEEIAQLKEQKKINQDVAQKVEQAKQLSAPAGGETEKRVQGNLISTPSVGVSNKISPPAFSDRTLNSTSAAAPPVSSGGRDSAKSGVSVSAQHSSVSRNMLLVSDLQLASGERLKDLGGVISDQTILAPENKKQLFALLESKGKVVIVISKEEVEIVTPIIKDGKVVSYKVEKKKLVVKKQSKKIKKKKSVPQKIIKEEKPSVLYQDLKALLKEYR